jgi:hypothetical protein
MMLTGRSAKALRCCQAPRRAENPARHRPRRGDGAAPAPGRGAARAGREPQTLRQIGHAGGVLHRASAGRLRLMPIPTTAAGVRSRPGVSSTRMPASLRAVHQHVVGPLELHSLDAQFFERPRHGQAHHQGQAGRHRRAGGEAPQGEKVRLAPGQDCHTRPRRPRPDVCTSAASTCTRPSSGGNWPADGCWWNRTPPGAPAKRHRPGHPARPPPPPHRGLRNRNGPRIEYPANYGGKAGAGTHYGVRLERTEKPCAAAAQL